MSLAFPDVPDSRGQDNGNGSEETLRGQKSEQGGKNIHGDLQKPDNQTVSGEGLFPASAGQSGNGRRPPPGQRLNDQIIKSTEETKPGQIPQQEKSLNFQPPESLPAAPGAAKDDPQRRPKTEGLWAVVSDDVCLPVEVLIFVQLPLTDRCTRFCRHD